MWRSELQTPGRSDSNVWCIRFATGVSLAGCYYLVYRSCRLLLVPEDFGEIMAALAFLAAAVMAFMLSLGLCCGVLRGLNEERPSLPDLSCNQCGGAHWRWQGGCYRRVETDRQAGSEWAGEHWWHCRACAPSVDKQPRGEFQPLLEAAWPVSLPDPPYLATSKEILPARRLCERYGTVSRGATSR